MREGMKRVVAQVVLVTFFSLSLFSCGGGGGGGGTPGGSTGGPDTAAPTVSSTSSANGATGVAVNAAISVIFSEPMDAATINAATFTVKAGSTAVPGTVSYSGTTATFTPTDNLANSTSYTVTVTTGAKDLAGNALASNYVWNFTSSSSTSTTATLPGPAPPPPPGTAAEQAAYYIALVASPETRLSGWLGLYDFLGVPVLQDGMPVGSTGDDPIGIPYWLVWYASGMDLPGRGLPLSDAGGLLSVIFTGSDNTAVGPALLDDVRSAAQSTDPKVAVLGLFIRERILSNTYHADILDPTILPTAAVIDLPTLQLIGWIVTRVALFQSVASEAAAPSLLSRIASRASRLLPKSPMKLPSWENFMNNKCQDVLGPEVDSTVNWFIDKLGGGFELGLYGADPYNPKFLDLVSRAIDARMDAAKTLAEKSERILKRVGYAMTFLDLLATLTSAALQYQAMDITYSQSPPPLNRTHLSNVHGDNGKITLELKYNKEKMWGPDTDKFSACAITFFTNILGAGFSFPNNGDPISYTDVKVVKGKNMTELVHFASGDLGAGMGLPEVKTQTNSLGLAYINVQGTARNEYIANPEAVMKEYTITVSAQQEEFGVESLVNNIWDRLSALAQPWNLIKVLVDTAKYKNWSLGELTFAVKDWREKCAFVAQDHPVIQRLNGLPAPMAGEVCVDSWSGTSTVVGGNPWATVSANVTWVLDPAPDNGSDNIVHYYATGTFSIESGEPCAVMTPTDTQIAAYGTNHPYGFLEINYNTSPPSYKGYGMGAFELTNVCQSGSTTSMIPWFQTEPTITGWTPLDNNVMAGIANLGGPTCTYKFTHD